jgi:hypothetical protein
MIHKYEGPICEHPRSYERIDRSSGLIIQETIVWTDSNGEDHHLRCRSNSCRGCVVVNAQRTVGAIQLAQPTHWLGLTLVGSSGPEICRRFSRFADYVREAVPGFEYVWAAEANPGHTGTHLHGFAHTGSIQQPIPRDAIDYARRRAGFGPIWKLGTLGQDVPLDFLWYPFKTLEDADDELIDQFFKLNGTAQRRRYIHASRGFWRDGPQGERILRRDAEVIAYRRSRMGGMDQGRTST